MGYQDHLLILVVSSLSFSAFVYFVCISHSLSTLGHKLPVVDQMSWSKVKSPSWGCLAVIALVSVGFGIQVFFTTIVTSSHYNWSLTENSGVAVPGRWQLCEFGLSLTQEDFFGEESSMLYLENASQMKLGPLSSVGRSPCLGDSCVVPQCIDQLQPYISTKLSRKLSWTSGFLFNNYHARQIQT